MRKALLFILLLPAVALSQEFHRATRVVQNPTVSDCAGYCFRGHLPATGETYCAEATALFARMTTQPTDTRKALINTTILSLQSAGLWNKIDRLFILAAHNEQASLLDWKGNSAATKVLDPSFFADQGWLSDGSGYLDGNFILSSLTNFMLSSARIATYSCTEAGASNATDAGAGTAMSASNSTWINPYYSGKIQGQLNGAQISLNITSALGLTSFTGNSTTVKAYKNGVFVGNSTTAPKTSVIGNDIFILCRNHPGVPAYGAIDFSPRKIAMITVGGMFTAEEEVQFTTIIESYMDAVGCGVIP